MNARKRRLIQLCGGLMVMGVVALWLLAPVALVESPEVESTELESVAALVQPGDPPKPKSFVVEGPDPIVDRVGAGLNAANGSAQRDLMALHDVLAAWRSNAPGQGNPAGTNREITAVLTGLNIWDFAIIPPDHPAINERGELCDRWGTPVFFHQLSRERMELRSCGPDRERFTDDDVVVSPGAP